MPALSKFTLFLWFISSGQLHTHTPDSCNHHPPRGQRAVPTPQYVLLSCPSTVRHSTARPPRHHPLATLLCPQPAVSPPQPHLWEVHACTFTFSFKNCHFNHLKKIILFIFGCTRSSLLCSFSLVVVKGGYLLVGGTGFPITGASLVAEHRL